MTVAGSKPPGRKTRLIHDLPDNSKGLIQRNPILQIHVTGKTVAVLITTAHPILYHSAASQNHAKTTMARGFSAAC